MIVCTDMGGSAFGGGGAMMEPDMFVQRPAVIQAYNCLLHLHIRRET